MTDRLSPFDPRDLPHQLLDRHLLDWHLSRTAPYKTGLEVTADTERAWAEYQAGAKAREAAERHAIDTRLEIEALDTYTTLGKAIGGITTQESWVGLAEEVERLVAERELSSRHGDELQARLLRVARDRRWTEQ